MAKIICLTTPGHLSQNPRLIKYAEALEAEGHHIIILSSAYQNPEMQYDRTILSQHPKWEHHQVVWDYQSGPPSIALRLFSGIRCRLAQKAFFAGAREMSHAYAECRIYPELLRALRKISADLYIGFCLSSLALVTQVAKEHRKPFCFDFEDAYSAALDPELYPWLEYIERKYIRQAQRIFVSSQGIGEYYIRKFGIIDPTVILNVFSIPEKKYGRQILLDRKDASRISLYWFSQTVGLDRGLQDFLQALRLIEDMPLELHLRGKVSQHVRSELLNRVAGSPIARRIYFHSPLTPDELLLRMPEHDIGLALEALKPLNRDLCITNKIFSFLVSGLAVVASRTSGQQYVFQQAPGIGEMFEQGNIQAIALAIRRLATDKSRLELCKKAALNAAKNKFNWARESQKMTDVVRSIFG